jgi:hypothetical protein
LDHAHARHHWAGRRAESAFADVRRALAQDLGEAGFGVACGGIPTTAAEIPSSLQSWGWLHEENEKLQIECEAADSRRPVA